MKNLNKIGKNRNFVAYINIYKIQNKIRKNMLKIFDKETAGILIGMLIGETTDISKVIQENFKTSRSYAFACCFGCKCNADYFTLKYDIF